MDNVLKAKTRKELASEYGVTVNTLKTRLKKAGIILSPGLIFPDTLIMIYDKLGYPRKF